MGNNQSSSQFEKPFQLAISPYPLVSVVSKPVRTNIELTSISSSINSSQSCPVNIGVIESDRFRRNGASTISGKTERENHQLFAKKHCKHHCRLVRDECSNPHSCQQPSKLQRSEEDTDQSSQQLKLPPLSQSGTQFYNTFYNSENTSAQLHQNHLNTKRTSHSSVDGCNECNDFNSHSSQCFSQSRKLVQDTETNNKETRLKNVNLAVQLSITDYTYDDSTVTGQNLEFHDCVLVERGRLCGPPDKRWEDDQVTRDHQIQNGGESTASNSGRFYNHHYIVYNPSLRVRDDTLQEVGTCASVIADGHDNLRSTISDQLNRNDIFREETTCGSLANLPDNLDHDNHKVTDPPIMYDSFHNTRNCETITGNFDCFQSSIPYSLIGNHNSRESRMFEFASVTGNLDNFQQNISDQSIKCDTSNKAKTDMLQNIYVNPITGEYHSMVFGSFNGQAASIIAGAGTYSSGQIIHSVVSGNFMNSGGASFGTECFSNVDAKDSFHNSCNSDFIPPKDCCVLGGNVGVFHSFNDEEQSFSGNHGTSKGATSTYLDSCERSNDSSEMNIESLHFPVKCSSHPDVNHQPPPRTRKAVSNCESCDYATERSLAATFGNNGSVCECCNYLSQSLAAETNSFTAAASSVFESKTSSDSWLTSSSDSFAVQTTGCSFVYYDEDNQDSYCSHDNNDKHSCNCNQNKIGSVMNRAGLSGLDEKVEKCEIATEDFGLDKEPNSAKHSGVFGQHSLNLCNKAVMSQIVAESNIRGTDSGEFNPIHTNVSNGKVGCLIKTARSDNSLLGGDSKHATTEVGCISGRKHTTTEVGCISCSKHTTTEVGCISDNIQHTKELTDDKHSFEFSPKWKSSVSFPAKKDTQEMDFDTILDSKINDGHRGGWITLPLVADNTNDVGGCDQGCSQNNGTRPKAHSDGNQERKEKIDSDGSGGRDRDGENRLWQISSQLSRVHSCNGVDSYQHNYVAYLCCAPDDLSCFGLTFHKTLEMWGFRIFIAPRDLELTGPKYENMSRWLEDRCNGKIIVVLSKNYGKSDECLFLTYFARTLDPDAKHRNIIPVMIDRNVEIPNVLKGLSIIKYNYDFRCGWLKKKLVNAIAA